MRPLVKLQSLLARGSSPGVGFGSVKPNLGFVSPMLEKLRKARFRSAMRLSETLAGFRSDQAHTGLEAPCKSAFLQAGSGPMQDVEGAECVRPRGDLIARAHLGRSTRHACQRSRGSSHGRPHSSHVGATLRSIGRADAIRETTQADASSCPVVR
jgi:hypothetical protein